MPSDPFLLETALDDHSLQRLKAGLEAAQVPAQVSGHAVSFHDVKFGEQLAAWVERLIDYNHRIHQRARRDGRPLRRYKPRDEADLILATCLGLQAGDLASIIHEVVWRQPFPNANHRTATAALADAMGLAVPMQRLRAVTDPFFKASKALLDGSDQTLTDQEAKDAHHDVMVRLVAALQSIK